MQKNYWVHKKILITGANGFIGKHLAQALKRAGATTVELSRHSRSPNDKNVEPTNRKDIEKIFAAYRPHTCFHLASEALVEQGQKDPFQTFYNNVTSSLNILELCRIYKVKRIIVASTAHVYGNSPLPYLEAEPARPSRPYETSKTCVDLIAQSYADTFNLPVLIPRFVNIYGPGDLNFSRIIPKTVRSVIRGDRPTMWGGTAVRQYLYIEDAVRAYMRLAQITDAQMEKNRIYNFGTNESISVESLMGKIIALSGKQLVIQKIAGERPEELPKQLVSWDKAKRVLGWKPLVTLDIGLRHTLDWYHTII